MTVRVGVDSGGTFTDAVAVDADGAVRVAKVPSTASDPERATIRALEAVTSGLADTELRHGTTVPTNTLLERKGARTALVTTRGFGDVIEIGRQRRPDLYDINVDRPHPLVTRELRIEALERVGADGVVATPLSDAEIDSVVEAVRTNAADAVAVSFLHSYANPDHEARTVAALRDALGADTYVVASHEAANEFREFERTSTAVLHAYLGPGTARYFDHLARDDALPDSVLIMRSSGGLGAARDLARRPADALVSGPAAGSLAAGAVAAAAGFPDAVSFDMGGTSTDVCLIRAGRPELRALTDVGGYPCLAPALAVHTVGAGGGSIGRIDPGGALRVGPESAGAEPGPAAYGLGGVEPTVTDANVVLARVRRLVGGAMPLDTDAAQNAVDSLGGGAAEAIIDVVEANMDRALREVTIQRGVDPADLAIVAFGGAGGLHAAHLCRSLGARAVIVPPLAGLLSAVGLLAAPIRADRSQTVLVDLGDLDIGILRQLADDATDAVAWAGQPIKRSLADCRYRGQSHEITIPIEPGETQPVIAARFHAEHERVNGYRRPDAPVQVATVRVEAEVASPLTASHVLAAAAESKRAGLEIGDEVRGPQVLVEHESTTYVPHGFSARVDDLANLIITEG